MAHMSRGEMREQYRGFPAYGAVHDVVPNHQLRSFLYDFSRIADGVFAQDFAVTDEVVDPIPGYTSDEDFEADPVQLSTYDEEAVDHLQTLRLTHNDADKVTFRPEVLPTVGYDPRRYYRIFDPESLGVSVVEMDPSKRAAQAIRSVWEKQDLGAVENEARNEMGRRLPYVAARLLFNRVDTIGGKLANAPRSDVNKKLALFPDTSKFVETLSLIEDENEIIVKAIRQRLKQFVYPWDVIPHLTFAVFRADAQVDQIVEVKEAAEEYIKRHSFGVRLGDLTFRHKLVRK